MVYTKNNVNYHMQIYMHLRNKIYDMI